MAGASVGLGRMGRLSKSDIYSWGYSVCVFTSLNVYGLGNFVWDFFCIGCIDEWNYGYDSQ